MFKLVILTVHCRECSIRSEISINMENGRNGYVTGKKAACVFGFPECKSISTVQLKFRIQRKRKAQTS